MGFEGTVVSDQVRVLIEQYHIGSILLTAKNLKCIQVYLSLRVANG
jgi:beta-N-acetylhexosaminidase